MSDETTQREQIFAGKIRKCPNCGAQITTDTTHCPSCGFVIERETVSSAMDEFAKKFMSFTKDAQKRSFVESYPVPNNKADIRGFLNYAANQRDKDYPSKKAKVFWTDAWNNKCRIIVNQAIDVFGADAEFCQYLRDYKEDVEKSSAQNKKLAGRLRFSKIAKISIPVVLVLALLGGISYANKKKAAARQALIAGCVVPKENVQINFPDDIEVLSDAKVVTTNISQRVETKSKEPVWCLDTTVTVEVRSKRDIYGGHLENVKKYYPDFYNSPDFAGVAWFRTRGLEERIESAYQSQSATLHGFDNVHQISETILNIKEVGATKTLDIRLTQIAGSREECEALAISLHESGKFSFIINAYTEEHLTRWKNKHKVY